MEIGATKLSVDDTAIPKKSFGLNKLTSFFSSKLSNEEAPAINVGSDDKQIKAEQIKQTMMELDEKLQIANIQNENSLKGGFLKGLSAMLKPIFAEQHNELVDDDQTIQVPQAMFKTRKALKLAHVLHKSHPLIRQWLLTEPRCRFETLGMEHPLINTEIVKDVDYIFVLNGSLEVVCEKFLCNQVQSNVDEMNQRSMMLMDSQSINSLESVSSKIPSSPLLRVNRLTNKKVVDSSLATISPRLKPKRHKPSDFELVFTLEQNDFLDPDRISFTESQIKKRDFDLMPFLSSVTKKNSVNQRQNSDEASEMSLKKFVDNPLNGYRITQIKSSARHTEVLIIRHNFYKKYASANSIYNEISDKQLRELIEVEFGLQDASTRQKAQFFSLFQLDEFQKNDVLLQANHMPCSIQCLLEGEVQVFSDMYEPTEKRIGFSTVRTFPGSRIQKQQLDGTLGIQRGNIIGSLTKLTSIGLECPLLMMSSPFTYVAKSQLVVLTIKLEEFLKEIDSLPPKTIEVLQRKLQKKLNLGSLITEDNHDQKLCSKLNTIEKKFDYRQNKTVERQVISHFPLSSVQIQKTMHIKYLKQFQKLGKPVDPKGVKSTQLKGGITQEDMIRLEMRRQEIFLDYNNVEKYLQQLKQRKQGQKPEGELVRSIQLKAEQIVVDDALQPLSSRMIMDKKPEILYTKCNVNKRASRTRFTQSFKNKFFDKINAADTLEIQREQELEREKIQQLKHINSQIQRVPRPFDQFQASSLMTTRLSSEPKYHASTSMSLAKSRNQTFETKQGFNIPKIEVYSSRSIKTAAMSQRLSLYEANANLGPPASLFRHGSISFTTELRNVNTCESQYQQSLVGTGRVLQSCNSPALSFRKKD